MNISQSKLFAIASLSIGSVVVGLLPACFTKQSRKQWPLFLSSLLCFGGGVLLCTSLVHILPEVRESTREEYKQYTELFFCMGFFVLYLIDEIVHFFYGEIAGHSHNSDCGARPQLDDRSSFSGRQIADNFARRHSTGPRYNYGTYPSAPQGEGTPFLRPYNPNFPRAKSDSMLFCDEQPPSQLCHVMHQEPCQSSAPMANLGLLVALSVHSLLEGLVVGLEGIPSKVLLLLGAIASHKLVVGFCLGVELSSNEQIAFCKHLLCILVFAVSSVVGIVLGIIIFDIPSDVIDIVIPILQALAGGSLLYVTVSEVLPRERARWHQKHAKRFAGVVQLISVLVGFGAMALVSKYLDH